MVKYFARVERFFKHGYQHHEDEHLLRNVPKVNEGHKKLI